jgi:hypothetical protein
MILGLVSKCFIYFERIAPLVLFMRFKHELRAEIIHPLIITLILGALWVLPTPVAAASPAASLPIGSHWILNGTSHYTASGSGIFAGEWTRDAKSTEQYTVQSRDANTITITYAFSGSYSNTATETWVNRNGGKSNQGTFTPTQNDYTIDLATLKVTAVTNSNNKNDVGTRIWFMINPQGLSHGSTLSYYWKGSEVPWKVSEPTPFKVKGTNVNGLSITYSDEANGWWNVDKTYSRGLETDTVIFDSTYGLLMGVTQTGNYEFTKQGGGWTETKSLTSEISDTNINFSQSILSQLFAPFSQPYLISGIVAIIVLIIVTGFVMMRRRGQTKPPFTTPLPPLQPQPSSVPPKTVQQVRPPIVQQSDIKFCINCGIKIPIESTFCKDCGAKQS